jgi:hypothetical protein
VGNVARKRLEEECVDKNKVGRLISRYMEEVAEVGADMGGGSVVTMFEWKGSIMGHDGNG